MSRSLFNLCATTVLMSGLCAPAMAQERPSAPPPPTTPAPQSADIATTETPADDIVVTGVRGSLDAALDTKRNSDVILDGISAEDIGLLPDVSISEALIRVPGVTSNSDFGESGQVSIRGLGPDLALTTINGRLLTTSDPANRRVTLQDLPSEGLSQALILKTPMAKTIEGGVAGTIDLETIKPLARKKRVFNIVGRAVYNGLADKFADARAGGGWGWRAEATYIDQFADNRLGIALVYAGLRDHGAGISVEGDDYRLANGVRADLNGDGVVDAAPSTLGPQDSLRERERHSFIGVLQWLPTDTIAINLDTNFSAQNNDTEVRRFYGQGVFNGSNGPATSFTIANNSIVAMQTTTLIHGAINSNMEKDKTYGAGLNVAFNDGPWKATFDIALSRSRGDSNNPILQFESDGTNATQARRPFGYNISDPANPRVFFDPSAADPADYNLPQLDIVNQFVRDKSFAVRTDFQYKIGSSLLRSIEFGLRYDRRHHTLVFDRSLYTFANQAARPDVDASDVAGPNPFASDPRDNGGPVIYPYFDIGKLTNRVLTAANVQFSDAADQDRGTSDDVEENTFAGYAQVNLDTTLFGRPLTGNVGARYFMTDSRSIGSQTTFSVIANANGTFTIPQSSIQGIPVTGRNTYSKFLPALNLNYNLGGDLYLRLAATRAIARPLFAQLTSSIGVTSATNVQQISVNIGNAQLKPFTADQLDLSLEWYPSRSTAITVAGYYKWVTNFTTQRRTNSTILATNGVTLVPVVYAQTVNDPTKRHFYGFEVNLRKDFTFLPGFLKHLGASVNYNYNSTDAVDDFTALIGNTVQLTPNNISKHVFNAILFYEDGPLSLRAAYRYSSDYTRTIFQSAQTLPSGSLDLSGGFSITRNFRLIANMTNLLNKRVRRYQFDYRDLSNRLLTENLANFGQVVTFGVRAKF